MFFPTLPLTFYYLFFSQIFSAYPPYKTSPNDPAPPSHRCRIGVCICCRRDMVLRHKFRACAPFLTYVLRCDTCPTVLSRPQPVPDHPRAFATSTFIQHGHSLSGAVGEEWGWRTNFVRALVSRPYNSYVNPSRPPVPPWNSLSRLCAGPTPSRRQPPAHPPLPPNPGPARAVSAGMSDN